MLTIRKKIDLPILFEFFIFIGIVELFFHFILKSFGYQQFQMYPYLRLFNMLFSFLFLFSKGLVSINKMITINLKNTQENKLILFWLFATIICFFVGVINQNSVLYLFTDSIYIFYGYFLFRTFCNDTSLQNMLNIELTKKQDKRFVSLIVIMSVISFALGLVFPNFLLVFTIVYALHLYNKKEYLFSFLLTIPFWFQILATNRSMLMTVGLVLFFKIFQNRFTRERLNQFFYVITFFAVLGYFFLDDFFYSIYDLLPPGSDFKLRMYQLYSIMNGHFDWNSPSFLSLRQRFDEAELVIKYWLSNPMNFIFGGGMGATIEGFAFDDASVISSAILGTSKIHNIHFLPIAFIFRYGVLGIIIFIMLLLLVVKYLLIVMTSKPSIFTTIIIFQFCWILYSMPSASFLWPNPLFWVLFAYISNSKITKNA